MRSYQIAPLALLVLLAFLTIPELGRTEISRLRAVGLFGVGSAYAQSFGGSRKSYTEAPFAGSGGIEYFASPLFGIGVEHVRSYGNGQTGFGLTGGCVRMYFSNDHPQYRAGILTEDVTDPFNKFGSYQIRAVSPYIGIGGGFAQATVPSVNVMALNEYLNFKFGFDYSSGNIWGYRTEANLVFSVAGSGYISLGNLIFGLYFFL